MQTARSRFIAAAFDHGQVPTIACFNKATTALGVDFARLVAALQKFVDQYFVPVWGTPARLLKTTGFRKAGSAQFDYAKRVKRPFQILPGGYMSVFKNGKWTQVFGSRAKAGRFRQEDRREHRSTYRGRMHRMRPSRPRGVTVS